MSFMNYPQPYIDKVFCIKQCLEEEQAKKHFRLFLGKSKQNFAILVHFPCSIFACNGAPRKFLGTVRQN